MLIYPFLPALDLAACWLPGNLCRFISLPVTLLPAISLSPAHCLVICSLLVQHLVILSSSAQFHAACLLPDCLFIACQPTFLFVYYLVQYTSWACLVVCVPGSGQPAPVYGSAHPLVQWLMVTVTSWFYSRTSPVCGAVHRLAQFPLAAVPSCFNSGVSPHH